MGSQAGSPCGLRDAPRGTKRLRPSQPHRPRPQLESFCFVLFFEQPSHSSSRSQRIIFPVGRREGLCPSTSGISEEAERKLTHAERVPGASRTELVNRKLQVHSVGHPGVFWFVLLQPFRRWTHSDKLGRGLSESH